MTKIIVTLVITTLMLSFVNAQSEETKVAKPVLIDKDALSGIGLQKIDLKDEPEKDFYQKKLFGGEEISVFVVSTETWNNKISSYSFDEYVYLLNGQSIVKAQQGPTEVFNSGEHLFMPKGFVGEWEIRAGSNLHYELSVITSKRADPSKTSKDLSYGAIENSKLSGCQINFEESDVYEEVLRSGVELTIHLKAEKPREQSNFESPQEQLIHILSGKLELTDTEGTNYTFYTGDFFVLPLGRFKKNWKSNGHGMLKYLVIEKSK